MCEAKNFYVWLLEVLALLGILALCLWLALRPQSPSYTIVDFSIPQSSLANNKGQNGTFLYDLEIENPNKDSSIYYDDILLTFFYGQDTVGQRTIPAFHQGTGRTRKIIDYVDANPRVWRSLLNAISNATAEMKVGLLTRIQYKTWGKKSKHHGLDLQGHLKIGSNGKISGKKKKIKLTHASKKWRRYKA
ncbi:Protein NDR1 [Morella rubra]|uniref:Protein NDR1 n=1 Tax=Morella rubra TaxID=262757 RepID=A0A6A1UM23_9ROSI|nr:Protein NDR1 [Morella rubra]KAB1201331.1 Protein NDR1 [Morella rubra]